MKFYTGRISTKLSDYIENKILSNNDISWQFSTETSSYTKDNSSFITKDTLDSFQFEHFIVSSKNGVLDPLLLSEVISPLVNEYQKNYSHFPNLTNVSRAKINILTQNNLSDNTYNIPHIDDNIEHFVMIYYINDSDGDTYIFNETYDKTKKELTIYQRIKPKKGKFLVFDGKYFHSSSNPQKSTIRSVININFQ